MSSSAMLQRGSSALKLSQGSGQVDGQEGGQAGGHVSRQRTARRAIAASRQQQCRHGLMDPSQMQGWLRRWDQPPSLGSPVVSEPRDHVQGRRERLVHAVGGAGGLDQQGAYRTRQVKQGRCEGGAPPRMAAASGSVLMCAAASALALAPQPARDRPSASRTCVHHAVDAAAARFRWRLAAAERDHHIHREIRVQQPRLARGTGRQPGRGECRAAEVAGTQAGVTRRPARPLARGPARLTCCSATTAGLFAVVAPS
jgi:hypothetical protein